MNDLAQECAAYFQSRPAYLRAFRLLREKWKRYGRTAGWVKISKASSAEKEALGGFLNRDFSGDTVSFTVEQFEKALRETRFHTVSLPELLEAYFQEPLVSTKKMREKKEAEKEEFLLRLWKMADGFGAEAGSWIRQLIDEKKYGYQMVMLEYGKSPQAAKETIETVYRALRQLRVEPSIRMAVLGARVTRNPHAFDRNTAAGKLLIHALCHSQKTTFPRHGEELLMLYYHAGIRPDDISSFTSIYGIRLFTAQAEHPAYREFVQKGEPCVVTLFNLGEIKRAEAVGHRVYVLENQMVFSHICEQLTERRDISFICTSGQVKTASWLLLDLLTQAGYEIYYSGDFDPEGLMIAERVLRRYPRNARLWHMGPEDYITALSEEAISDRRLQGLAQIQLPCLQEVKEAIRQNGHAGYQEQLLPVLCQEMRENG